jgi:two-component system sensor histidine kinase RegB
MPDRDIQGRDELNFSWLIKLRWSSIAGQTATILGVWALLHIPIPLAPLFAIVGFQLATNVACAAWFRRGPRVYEWQLAGVMALDIALLTLMLYFTGGQANPFSFLYLVNIALAAVVLHAAWTWMLVALALLSFGLLPAVGSRPLPLGHVSADDAARITQQGMWVAFGVAAGFIVHFLWRITGALARRDQELSATRRQAARQQRVASLATMAAGAAHELATPLGTIALVARELERQMEGASPDVVEDVRLIRDQVARCRSILDQMSGGAGPSGADLIEEISIVELMDAATTGVRDRPEVSVEIEGGLGAMAFELPPRALAQAVRSLITNAQDAGESPVIVRASERGGELVIEVVDQGAGMAQSVLDRIGEPFYTTKDPGKGMGLGLFLSRAVVEGLGGRLDIDSAPERGTRVVVTIPWQRPEVPEHLNRVP